MKKFIVVISLIFAIFVTACPSPPPKVPPVDPTNAQEIDRDGRFIAYDDGTVLDEKSGLMWSAKDNGENINWHDAKRYCENHRVGGYSDWRLPTIDELRGLYDEKKSGYSLDCHSKNPNNIYLTHLIHVSCGWVWSSKGSDSSAIYFNLLNGAGHSEHPSSHNRVLPVRAGK